MQLRSNTVGATVEFHPEILFFLCFILGFMYIFVRKYIQGNADPAVVIYATPRMRPQTNTPMEIMEERDGEVIQIRIEFSPKTTVRRTRAPSALDLGSSASTVHSMEVTADEPKKEL